MRWLAGFLLVGAASLKAVQLLNEPALTIDSPPDRFFLPVQIGAEFAFSMLLLSGLYWRALRSLSVVLFMGFAGYSLYLATNGATSCGCFGSLRIHPWWTFFLDLVVALGLLISKPTSRQVGIVSNTGHTTAVLLSKSRSILAWALVSVAILAAALLVRYADRRTALAEGVLPATEGLVVLKPDQWVGKKLPIADFIDMDVSKGKWIVLLHRHDCPECQEAVPHYQQLALTGERVALVEVPPYGEMEPRVSPAEHGRLKDDRDWFVQTPVEIQLIDNVVTSVKAHGD